MLKLFYADADGKNSDLRCDKHPGTAIQIPTGTVRMVGTGNAPTVYGTYAAIICVLSMCTTGEL